MSFTTFLVEAAGWLGAALILGSYILVSRAKLEGRSRMFQSMNVAGAAGLVVNSAWHGAVPSTVLNVIWLGVGLATLWTLRRNRTQA